jgi:hypothetical protein
MWLGADYSLMTKGWQWRGFYKPFNGNESYSGSWITLLETHINGKKREKWVCKKWATYRKTVSTNKFNKFSKSTFTESFIIDQSLKTKIYCIFHFDKQSSRCERNGIIILNSASM